MARKQDRTVSKAEWHERLPQPLPIHSHNVTQKMKIRRKAKVQLVPYSLGRGNRFTTVGIAHNYDIANGHKTFHYESLIQCGRQPNLETTLWTFKHSTVQLQCYKVSAKIKLFSKPVSANQATPLKITKRAFVSNGDMAPDTYFVSWESKTATDKKMHSTSSLSALILNGVTRCLQIEVLCRA